MTSNDQGMGLVNHPPETSNPHTEQDREVNSDEQGMGLVKLWLWRAPLEGRARSGRWDQLCRWRLLVLIPDEGEAAADRGCGGSGDGDGGRRCR